MGDEQPVKGVAGMPSPYSKDCIRWEGDPRRLLDFLGDYEVRARECGLTDREKCEVLLRYIPDDARDLWEVLEQFKLNYAVWRTKIEEVYPELQEVRKVRVADLSKFVGDVSRGEPLTDQTVKDYYRRFITMSKPLRTQEKIGKIDEDTLFWSGFPDVNQRVLDRRLLHDQPDRSKDEPWGMADVYKAAMTVLGSSTRWAEVDGGRGTGWVKEEEVARGRGEVRVRFATPAATPIRAKSEDRDIDALVSTMHASARTSLEYHKAYTRLAITSPKAAEPFLKPLNPHDVRTNQNAGSTASAMRSTSPTPFLNCMFCDIVGCKIRSCPVAADYKKKGWVKEDGNPPRFVFPDGSPIVRGPVGGIRKVVDDAMAGKTRDVPPHMSRASSGAMLVEYGEEAMMFSLERLDMSEVEDVGGSGMVDVREMQAEEVNDGVMCVGLGEVALGALAATRAPAKTNDQATKPSSSNADSTQNSVPASTQYHFSCDAEKVSINEKVFQDVLKGRNNMPLEELLSISPDIRRRLGEYQRVRKVEGPRVGAGMRDARGGHAYTVGDAAEVFEQDWGADEGDGGGCGCDRNQSQAVERTIPFSCALREVDVKLNGKVLCTGVLDTGSQLMLVREDVWKLMGASLDTSRRTKMHNADNQASYALGVADSVQVDIGGSIVYLHFSVVRDAPFQVLIGLPWMKQIQCRTIHSGDMVTLNWKDPDTGRAVSLPTSPRAGLMFPLDVRLTTVADAVTMIAANSISALSV